MKDGQHWALKASVVALAAVAGSEAVATAWPLLPDYIKRAGDGLKITDWLLVFVSAMQVWLLWRQMQIMTNQRDIMAGQLTAAVKAVDAAVVNAKAARTSAETAGATLKQMQDTASIQLRAYVSVESVRMSENLQEPRFTVKIRNSGQTPARNVQNYYKKEIAEFPLTRVLQAKHPGGGTRFTLSAGQSAMDSGLGGVIMDDERERLRQGNEVLYVYGVILYQDVFNKDQQTEFCFFCGGPAGMPKHRFLLIRRANT